MIFIVIELIHKKNVLNAIIQYTHSKPPKFLNSFTKHVIQARSTHAYIQNA